MAPVGTAARDVTAHLDETLILERHDEHLGKTLPSGESDRNQRDPDAEVLIPG